MSLDITQRPAQITGALSPVVYKFQRKDFQWDSIDDDGGFVRITFDSVDLQTSFTEDDRIYIKSSSGDFDEFGTVTDVDFTGGDTLVTTNIAYHSTADGGTSDDFVNNTTGRSLYQVAINLYDPSTNELLIDVPILYTPNSKGYLLVDVQLLKSVISPEVLNIVQYGESENDEAKYIVFHIGYTEQWSGSSESETLDNEYPRIAIFGVMQILGTNDYLTRLPERFLTRAEKLRLFRGKYFDLSYFGLVSIVTLDHYAQDGSLTITETVDADLNDGVSRVPVLPLTTDHKIICNLNNQISILPGTEWSDLGMFSPFTKATDTLSCSLTAPAEATAVQAMPGININNFNPIIFSVTISGAWTGDVAIYITLSNYNLESRAIELPFINSNGTFLITINTSIPIGTSSLPDLLTVNAVKAAGTGTADIVITIPNGQVIDSLESSKEIEIVDPCKNPVTLSWCNEVGGQEWWTFDWSQEHSYDYADGRKAKRILLSTDSMTLNQWNLVNGLNTIGEVYNRSIPELESSVKGTQKRINSQVYLLLDDLTLLEVIVIPSLSATQSKKVEHQLQIQIELPEGYVQDNFTGLTSYEDLGFIVLPAIFWDVDVEDGSYSIEGNDTFVINGLSSQSFVLRMPLADGLDRTSFNDLPIHFETASGEDILLQVAINFNVDGGHNVNHGGTLNGPGDVDITLSSSDSDVGPVGDLENEIFIEGFFSTGPGTIRVTIPVGLSLV